MRAYFLFLGRNLCLSYFLFTIGHKLPKIDWKCHGVQKPCPTVHIPVCGSDGKTYRNRCVLHKNAKCVVGKEDLVIATEGKCSDEGSKYHLNRTIPRRILIYDTNIYHESLNLLTIVFY